LDAYPVTVDWFGKYITIEQPASTKWTIKDPATAGAILAGCRRTGSGVFDGFFENGGLKLEVASKDYKKVASTAWRLTD
jgi:hypothetical protein